MGRKFSGIFPQLSKNMMLQLPPLMKVTTKIILILQLERTNILVLYFSGRNLKGKEICIKNLPSRIRQPLSASSSLIDKAAGKKAIIQRCHAYLSPKIQQNTRDLIALRNQKTTKGESSTGQRQRSTPNRTNSKYPNL